MKLHRKIALALAVPVAASSLLIASPTHAAQSDVCAIVGSIHLSNGIDLVTNAGSGTYSFRWATVVCAGTMVTGTGPVASTGTYANTAFSGTFMALGCTGVVSGSRTVAVLTAQVAVSCPPGSAGGNVELAFVPDPITMIGTVAYDAAIAGPAAFLAVP